MMVFYKPEEMSVPSPAYISLSDDPERMLKEVFPNAKKFIEDNKKEILDALKDCMIGT